MSHFVPTDAIAKLVEGSYEHLTASLDDLLQVDGTRRKVIATFPSHVVVAEATGKFSRVEYAQAADGSIKILATEEINIPTYSPERVTEFVFHEAEDIVAAFLTGNKGALARLEGLVPFVTEDVRRKSEAEAVDAALAAVRGERVWRKLYTERADLIKTVLGAVTVEAVEPKFKLLVTGEIPVTKHEGYRELVQSDLTHLAKQIEGQADSVEAGSAVVSEVKERASDDAEAAATLAVFESFASDLAADLRGMSLLVAESLKNVRGVANLGRLHDGLAAEFTNHEIAGRFVQQMAEKLCESHEA